MRIDIHISGCTAVGGKHAPTNVNPTGVWDRAVWNDCRQNNLLLEDAAADCFIDSDIIFAQELIRA